MTITGIVIALVVGAIAGFLAGQIVKGHGFGLVGNMVVGIVGAYIFGLLFGNFNLLSSPLLNEIVGGTLGASLLLVALRLFKKVA